MKKKYQTVAAVIEDEDGKILVEDHVKIGGYVIPGGKIDNTESEYSALCRELNEELGIIVDHMIYDKVMTFEDIEYPYGTGDLVDFEQWFYIMKMYHGTIENKEPQKHRELLWLSKEDLINNPYTSRVLRDYLLSK